MGNVLASYVREVPKKTHVYSSKKHTLNFGKTNKLRVEYMIILGARRGIMTMNDNEIHLFKPNFIYTIDNKYCL